MDSRSSSLELFHNKQSMFLIALLFAANLLVFATRLGAHPVLAAAVLINGRRKVNALQLAAAIMKVDGHSTGGKTINHQEQYDQEFFHAVLQTYAMSLFY